MKAVMAMYEGAQTAVRTEGDSKAFNVKVRLHQGSVLSLLLFVIVMEMISRELQEVELKEVCLMQASRSSAFCKVDRPLRWAYY